MYARQPPEGRYSVRSRVPSNYSGNAFKETVADEVREEAVKDEDEIFGDTETAEVVSVNTEHRDNPDRSDIPSSGVGRLFGRGGGGIGFEELLILGLAFLISQNDSRDDLTYLLLLLLFIQ